MWILPTISKTTYIKFFEIISFSSGIIVNKLYFIACSPSYLIDNHILPGSAHSVIQVVGLLWGIFYIVFSGRYFASHQCRSYEENTWIDVLPTHSKTRGAEPMLV